MLQNLSRFLFLSGIIFYGCSFLENSYSFPEEEKKISKYEHIEINNSLKNKKLSFEQCRYLNLVMLYETIEAAEIKLILANDTFQKYIINFNENSPENLQKLLSKYFNFIDPNYLNLANSFILFTKKEYTKSKETFREIVEGKYYEISRFYLNTLDFRNGGELHSNFFEFNDSQYRRVNDIFRKIGSGETLNIKDLDFVQNNEIPKKNFLLGEIYFDLKNYRLAINHFKIYRLKNRISYINQIIGLSYYHLYKYSNAAYYWIQNLEESKSHFDKQALYDLSDLYFQTTNYHLAIPYYEKYIAKYGYPKDNGWIGRYTKCFSKLNRLEKLHKILEKDFTNFLIIKEIHAKTLAKYFYDKNKYKIALNYFEIIPELSEEEEFNQSMCEYYVKDSGNYHKFVMSFINANPNNKFSEKMMWELGLFFIQKNQYSEYKMFYDQNDINSNRTKFLRSVCEFEINKDIDNFLIIWTIFNELENQKDYFYLIPDFREISNTLSLSDYLKDIDKITQDYFFLYLAEINENEQRFESANKLLELISFLPYDEKLSLRIAQNYIAAGKYEISNTIIDTLQHNKVDEKEFEHTRILLEIAQKEYLSAALNSSYYLKQHGYNFDIFNDLIICLHAMEMELYKENIFVIYGNELNKIENFNIKKLLKHVAFNKNIEINLETLIIDLEVMDDLQNR